MCLLLPTTYLLELIKYIGNYLNKMTIVLLDLQQGDARFQRPLSSLTKLRSPAGNQGIRFHGN